MTHARWWTRLCCAAVCAAVVAGCGSSGGNASQPAASATPDVSKAWTDALAGVGARGTYDLAGARRLFAATYGDQADGAPVGSGTPALWAMFAHWAELTSLEQVAVSAVLTPASPPVMVPPALPAKADYLVPNADPTPCPSPGRPGCVAGIAVPPEFAAGASRYRAALVARLGFDFPGPLLLFMGNPRAGGVVGATVGFGPSGFTFSQDGTRFVRDIGGPFMGCAVLFYPGLLGFPEEIENTIAHEIFHCFQLSGYGVVGRGENAPAWITEGQAEWAAAELAGPTKSTTRWLTTYLQGHRPVITRTYDAAGFYAHLAETGTSPYKTMPGMWQAWQDDDAAFHASGADASGFLDSWASSRVLDVARGQAWNASAPGMPGPGFGTTREGRSVAQDQTIYLTADPYDQVAYHLTISSDVVVFGGTGHARVNDGTKDVENVAGGAQFCVRSGGCDCPNGPRSTLPKLGSDVLLGATGNGTGTQLKVEGRKACGPRMVRIPRKPHPGFPDVPFAEIHECKGVKGPWTGQFNFGGFKQGALDFPLSSVNVAFTFDDSGHAPVTGSSQGVSVNPEGVTVSYDLALAATLQPGDDAMKFDGSIVVHGSGGIAAQPFTITISLAEADPTLTQPFPLTDAPAGTCPA